jgi:zinc transport system substrate-binding protein
MLLKVAIASWSASTVEPFKNLLTKNYVERKTSLLRILAFIPSIIFVSSRDYVRIAASPRRNNQGYDVINKVIAIISVLIAVLAILAISHAPNAETTEKMGVVVTILPQAEFVESVGGEKVTVTVMVPPGRDPHTYSPTISDLVAVKQAKLYAEVGSGIDFELSYMDSIVEANRNMLVVDCSNGVELVENDPHIWLSPRNAKIMVENICDGLIEVDPQNRDYYIQNGDEYLAKLDKLDTDISGNLTGITNRWFIVFHPAWGYFARDYNLTQVAIEIEGKTPSPKDIADVLQDAEEHNIKMVFASPEFDVKSAQTIAEAIGGRVAFIDPLARDYIVNMHKVLGELVQGMK